MDETRHLHLRGALSAARSITHGGKECLIVPVIALMDGVIHAVNASNPERVTTATLAKAAASWNGRPLVLGHPTKDGRQCSANDPSIEATHHFGTIFNSRMVGPKLLMDAYVDPVRAAKIGGPQFVQDLRDGKQIEVSVGAYVQTKPEEGTYNGRAYKAAWLETHGDHLAFLPGGKGACSIEMGCGAHRAAEMYLVTAEGFEVLGGPGSGNHGHSGRPGKVGGSGGGGKFTLYTDGGQAGAGSKKVIGEFSSMDEAKKHVDQMEEDGKWPEGHNALVDHPDDGDTYMYVDDWDNIGPSSQLPKESILIEPDENGRWQWNAGGTSSTDNNESSEGFATKEEAEADIQSLWNGMTPEQRADAKLDMGIKPKLKYLPTEDGGRSKPFGRKEQRAEDERDRKAKESDLIRKAIKQSTSPIVVHPRDKKKLKGASSKDCSVCNGTGQVKNEQKQEDCPSCEGLGKITTAETNDGTAVEEVQMKKVDAIKALTACPCSGFVAADAKELEAFSEERLTAMAEAATTRKAEQDKVAADLKTAADQVVELKAAAAKQPTEEEAYAKLPASLRTLVDKQKAADAAEKATLVASLKAASTALTEEQLNAKSLEDLKILAAFAKIETPANYSGRSIPALRATAAGDMKQFTPPDPYAAGIKVLQASK